MIDHKWKHGKKLIILLVFSFLVFYFVFLPIIFREHYVSSVAYNFDIVKESPVLVEEPLPTYLQTPVELKAIYMTSWVASQKSLREELVRLIDQTELNSIVIDIKDYSGKIVFKIKSPELKQYGSEEVRVRDLREFIEELHQKGIYVIGRIAVFQDAYFVKYRPDLAVKNKSGSSVWKDRKGISWIDPASQEYWDYIVLLSKEARDVGFDEINFDYIRFPSDGDMSDISYPWSSSTPKTVVLENFFKYLSESLLDSGLTTSADLFGMVTTAQNDMGIGQILEKALPYFDYISPMVYPSHYPPNFEGFKNPEAHPYEIVNLSLKRAVERAIVASSSPEKIRPWLQDFGLKMTYGPNEVRAQIKAVNDLGLSSWMLWSASNRYTKDALGI